MRAVVFHGALPRCSKPEFVARTFVLHCREFARYSDFQPFCITLRCRRRACPGDPEWKARSQNNRDGRDKPGHDGAALASWSWAQVRSQPLSTLRLTPFTDPFSSRNSVAVATSFMVASFFVGVAAYGVFGMFAFYLPELFPARLRATGAGFTYNFGRVFAAGGPFLVGWIAAQGANAIASATQTLFYVGFVPLLALLAVPFIPETRDRPLHS